MIELHHKTKVFRRTILLCGFLMTASLAFAQDDPILDSFKVVDSILESTTDDVVDSDKNDIEFVPLGTPGSGIDSYTSRKADTRGFLNDDAFWYANHEFKKQKQGKSSQARGGSGGSVIYQTFLWLVVIGGFIAFLIIYLSNSNVSLFRSSRSIKDTEADPETDDIFAINYAKEIEKAANAGNFRLAVRLLFLQLLRGLSERQIIQYTHDRTNFDYLLQVHHAPWYQHFFRLTRNYEYVWYGQFDIDLEKYKNINNDFTSFEKQLPPL